MQFMELINKVHSDYSGKVDFLAVDIATSEGFAFARQQDVGSAVLVLFGPDGARRGMLIDTITEKDFGSSLDIISSP